MNKKRLVVVGGGFGGLSLARGLARSPHYEIVLIDKRNFHLFQPLLYQVAMAGLSPAHIATPIRSIFAKCPNVTVVMDEVVEVDRNEKVLRGRVGSYPFDYLAMATGTRNFFFNNEQWASHSIGLKSLEEATTIRGRVLSAFERAESSPKEAAHLPLSFVVVGGGPTGVEMAGALGELTRYTFKKDFRKVNPRETEIFLVEGGPRILPSFHLSLSLKAEQTLKKLGVKVLTDSRVARIDGGRVELSSGRHLSSAVVVWAAGVRPQAPKILPDVSRDDLGRVLVEKDLSLPGDPNVFVMGDLARFEQGGQVLPGLAPVAMQQGRFVADLLIREARGRKRPLFKYTDKGQMATIGRRKAVLELGRLRLHGTLAWWLWTVVHIYFLIGFHSRFFVFIEWVWQYLRYKKGARLILDEKS